jgi:hypothetical protein
MGILRSRVVILTTCLLLQLSLVMSACSGGVKEDVTVSDPASPSFDYLLDRAYFEERYELIKYVLYQRIFRVDEANPLAEVLEQNLIFNDGNGFRVSIDQYIDRYVAPPTREPHSEYKVPLYLVTHYPLDFETHNLKIFSTICCSEEDRTTCQVIATRGEMVVYFKLLVLPAIGQKELMEILAEPMLMMDGGL